MRQSELSPGGSVELCIQKVVNCKCQNLSGSSWNLSFPTFNLGKSYVSGVYKNRGKSHWPSHSVWFHIFFLEKYTYYFF